MRPWQIPAILDLAAEARKQDKPFIPLFVSEAGLGKSALCKTWVQQRREYNPNFLFIDLRIAYMEQPDLIGLPKEVQIDSVWRTTHCIPELWPLNDDAEGLLLFEEPNRGTTGVMNCMMQILTDRVVHKVKIPKGIIIAGCINPDSASYDVSNMDAALKNRFEIFDVEYDAISFMEYMEKAGWQEDIQQFVASGAWLYKKPSKIEEGGVYISPRTWEKVNAALCTGVKKDRMMHRLIMTSILGKHIGNDFHIFSYEESPVTAADLIKNPAEALERLTKQSHKDDKNTYQGGMVATTIESIVKHYGGPKAECPPDQVCEELMAEVAKIIPADHAINLIKQCGFKQTKGRVQEYFKTFKTKYPELIHVLKDNLKIERGLKK